jgi:hypothetical protein
VQCKLVEGQENNTLTDLKSSGESTLGRGSAPVGMEDVGWKHFVQLSATNSCKVFVSVTAFVVARGLGDRADLGVKNGVCCKIE